MSTLTREEIHRHIAVEINNWAMTRFIADEGPGPRQSMGDDGSWLIRLKPNEAEATTRKVIEKLEQLGVIPARAVPFKEMHEQIAAALEAAGHAAEGDADFGFALRRPVDSGDHLIVVCEPNDLWRTMPGQAVRTAQGQHLARYTRTLAEAGYGVAEYVHDDKPWALIVASSQESADEQAPGICEALAYLNPPRQSAQPEQEVWTP
ncbi:hypothetical protein ACFWYW_57550 [Nonomuraea sp. NPDC059023]|uniref:hypothetical protein n=1 Tax=unclassified Nonomuraea TaxID=2593643 RepID=UPI0036A6F733